MKVRRGEIVMVDFPFTDGTGSKVRPALVVQCDFNNGRLDDTIVVSITSRTARAAVERTQLLVDPAAASGRSSGLLFASAVQCENILTVDCASIRRRIGTLSAPVMLQIDECLKASLAIP
jgi:mRNA interferase MazF